MNNEKEKDLKRLQDACSLLSNHFDTVQIFVTRHQPHDEENKGTRCVVWGIGNWYARYGQVKEWIIKEEKMNAE